MKIKVLELPRWITNELNASRVRKHKQSELLGSKSYPEVTPVFNRNGAYRKGNECWVECNGKAYRYEIDMFDYELQTLHASCYNKRQIDALDGIIREKMATRQQRQLMYYILSWHSIRSASRNTRLSFVKSRKEYKL